MTKHLGEDELTSDYEFEFRGGDWFAVLNGQRIAKRSKPGSWVALVPGCTLPDDDDDKMLTAWIALQTVWRRQH